MFLANSFQSANPFAALRSRVPTCNHPTSLSPRSETHHGHISQSSISLPARALVYQTNPHTSYCRAFVQHGFYPKSCSEHLPHFPLATTSANLSLSSSRTSNRNLYVE